jgi:phage FluMu protein Com
MTKEWIKVATCTHCNKQIEKVGKTWVHSKPEPELKTIDCTTINFATPQRGSVRSERRRSYVSTYDLFVRKSQSKGELR